MIHELEYRSEKSGFKFCRSSIERNTIAAIDIDQILRAAYRLDRDEIDSLAECLGNELRHVAFSPVIFVSHVKYIFGHIVHLQCSFCMASLMSSRSTPMYLRVTSVDSCPRIRAMVGSGTEALNIARPNVRLNV